MTRLKHERISRGLSQDRLARSAGLHQWHVSLMERGHLVPTPMQLGRLALVLELPPADLLKEVVIVAEAPRAAEATR